MKYCVVKNTTTIVDGSENSEKVMYENAENAGYDNKKVEILTQEEYETRLIKIKIPISSPSIEERIVALENLLMKVL
ncbi:hypothetical protein [Clostridium gasigenes]|uniref:Uncharacterized protein n=1 Tax=Clostridium gasigenes TaxID=94869 RepID=A0A1H0M8W0_9CLOT|nr:hypothetical protein [Clostridium gasigenes]SDO76834.1 hypothetical protein SAMN04488529_101366 [Clostridium gasigenes]